MNAPAIQLVVLIALVALVAWILIRLTRKK